MELSKPTRNITCEKIEAAGFLGDGDRIRIGLWQRAQSQPNDQPRVESLSNPVSQQTEENQGDVTQKPGKSSEARLPNPFPNLLEMLQSSPYCSESGSPAYLEHVLANLLHGIYNSLIR